MLAHGFGRVLRKRDAIVTTDIIEGIASKGFGLELAAELGKLLAAGLEITIERTVTDVGQCGQFRFTIGSFHIDADYGVN